MFELYISCEKIVKVDANIREINLLGKTIKIKLGKCSDNWGWCNIQIYTELKDYTA